MTESRHVPAPRFRSPLHSRPARDEKGTSAAGWTLALADASQLGQVRIHARPGARPLGATPPAVGWAQRGQWGTLARLLPDELALLTEDRGAARRMASRFSAQPRETGLTVTDWSHGQASLWLLGGRAPQALARLGSLDFGEHAFPDLKVAQCALAGVRGLVVRLDAPDCRSYYLSVGRSYGAYLWDRTAEIVARLGGSIWEAPRGNAPAGRRPRLRPEVAQG